MNERQKQPANATENLSSAREISLATGIPEWSLYRNAEIGDLESVRVGQRVMFRPEDIAHFLSYHAAGIDGDFDDECPGRLGALRPAS